MNTYYVAGFPYSDELFHFGIKGQKWGIRRYQNPDGTLTAAGKQRYSQNPERLMKDYRENWTQSYNSAAQRSGSEYQRINKKYENADLGRNFETKSGQQYVKEISKAWKSIYMDELRKDYSEASKLAGIGEDWMKNAMYMNIYDDYIIKKK